MQTTATDKVSKKNAELKYVTLAKPIPAKFFYSISFSWSSVFLLLLSFRFVFIVIVIDLTHKQRAFVCISSSTQHMLNVLFRAIDQ